MPDRPERVRSFAELYREIEALPEHVTGQISVPGVLTTMGRPGAPHEHTQAVSHRALEPVNERFGGHGWWIRQEFEVRFPGDRLAVPDLAGWRAAEHPELPGDHSLRIIPAWCAEILSPKRPAAEAALDASP